MTIPLSLYIHFPWCVKKCPYCDFNSHEISEQLPETAYIEALNTDLENDLIYVNNRRIKSIFLGGGTPSLFSPEAVRELINRLRQVLVFDPSVEITMEANPGTVDRNKFSGFLDAGVNRLSIGAQSLSDKQLKSLGRIHSSNDVLGSVETARQVGFKNFNLDLMHGLVNQSLNDAMLDLKRAIALNPTHISWYQLTIEPNTLYYKDPPTLPDDDHLWEIYSTGLDLLADHGYQRYEISAYSKPGFQSRHNLNYWQFGDYLGIGAGAHGKLTRHNTVTRSNKTRLPENYLRNPNTNVVELRREDLPLEFLMNALRLTEGFTPDLFRERTGLEPPMLESFLSIARERQLIDGSSERIKATPLGFQFLNELLLLVN